MLVSWPNKENVTKIMALVMTAKTTLRHPPRKRQDFAAFLADFFFALVIEFERRAATMGTAAGATRWVGMVAFPRVFRVAIDHGAGRGVYPGLLGCGRFRTGLADCNALAKRARSGSRTDLRVTGPVLDFGLGNRVTSNVEAVRIAAGTAGDAGVVIRLEFEAAVLTPDFHEVFCEKTRLKTTCSKQNEAGLVFSRQSHST